MNQTRNGKIARLPKTIREELNRRLDNGEKGQPLLNWLNSLPDVQALVAAEFGGLPVNKQSLSQWRRGGFGAWLRQQEACAMAQQMLSETRELQPANAPPLTDQMAGWVTVRYLVAVRKLMEEQDRGKPGLDVLREFCHDLVALRRGDHSAARLKMEQERRERAQVKSQPPGTGAGPTS
jgi:hypothetical protein